jgi:ribosome-binding protein aMBF1 (putative translation factor)
MKGYCSICGKEVDEVEYMQNLGVCSYCIEFDIALTKKVTNDVLESNEMHKAIKFQQTKFIIIQERIKNA